MRRITWPRVALTGVVVAGLATVIGLVAWLAPEQIERLLLVLGTLAAREALPALARMRPAAKATASPSKRPSAWRGER